MYKLSILDQKRGLLLASLIIVIASFTYLAYTYTQTYIISESLTDDKSYLNPPLNPEQCICDNELVIQEDEAPTNEQSVNINIKFPPLPQETMDKINKNLLKNRILVVATANYGMRNHVYNWIESLKRTKETNFIIFCLDEKLYEHLALTGHKDRAAKIPETWFHQAVEDDFSLYFSETYRIITHAKTLVVQQLLYLDITVFFSDIDIVWIRPHIVDYMDALMQIRPQTGVLFQQEGVDQREVNSGFYLMRPTDLTKRLLAETIVIQDTDKKLTQQGAMNVALNKLDLDVRTTSVVLLDLLHFPNGHIYFNLDLPRQRGIQPYIVHANYLASVKKKNCRYETIN
ncbi:hypothetical protein G6F56_000278 [Rhizopus delemar]|nr:hypothetical protein G6F56_000278 [Rhizopus delemar]